MDSNYSPTQNDVKHSKKYILLNEMPLTDTLYSKLFKDHIKSKKYFQETLKSLGMLQGVAAPADDEGKGTTYPVIALPMGKHSFHSVNYSDYPKPPRFLNISSSKKYKVALNILGSLPSTADSFYLTEGIWDLCSLTEMGLPALALPGVNNLEDDWCEVFDKKHIFILFDNDDAGREWSHRQARVIAMHAASVRIITLPKEASFKKKKCPIKDISDLFMLDKEFAVEMLQQLSETAEEVNLSIKERIREVVIGSGTNIEKAMLIASMIQKDVTDQGGRIIPYNNEQEFAMVLNGVTIITDEEIDTHLSKTYEYLPSYSLWRNVRDLLYTFALQNASSKIHLYSHHQDSCYIGTKAQGLIRIASGSISMHPQGHEDIFVKTGSTLDTACIAPTTIVNPITIESLFDLFIYDGETAVQKFLLKVWFYHTFFNPQMRVILCVTGDPGSGKTLLLKIMKGALFGFKGGTANPNSMPEEDYVFTLMMKTYKYLFLDEINDSDIRIKTKFRMLATGEESVFRPKYAKQNVRFRSKLWLAVSAHSPKFRESDIAQRLVVIRLSHPSKKVKLINENQFLNNLEKHRSEIWSGIISTLQTIMNNLEKNKDEQIPLTNYCRQVEMADFAYRAFPEERDLCVEAFNKINLIQEKFASEYDPIIDLMDDWMFRFSKNYINGDASKINVKAKDIYEDMHVLSRERGLKSFPASVQGFGKWINGRQSVLNELHGYVRYRNLTTNAFEYIFNIKPPEEGRKETF